MLGGFLLVRRIGVGVHEEDRDRLDGQLLELRGERRERRLVERRDDLALAPMRSVTSRRNGRGISGSSRR